VYKLQNLGSSLKYKSFLREVADCWAGMASEETHEEDDIHVEAADEGDDHPTCTKKRSVGRPSVDMEERQLEAIVGQEWSQRRHMRKTT
jgi:hypothetical protein